MIDRLIDWLHRLRRGHEPVWVSRFDGIGFEWYCAACVLLRDGARK